MSRGVLILSHRRPDRVETYRMLRRFGYTGPIRVVVDDQDPVLGEYRARFGDELIVFSKAEFADRLDLMDRDGHDEVVVYARQAAWDIADSLGWEAFAEFDDDYAHISPYRTPSGRFVSGPVARRLPLDEVFEAFWDALLSMPERVVALTLAQGGDFFHKQAGARFVFPHTRLRKAMNTWFLTPSRRFDWLGRLNEDTNVYLYHGGLGLVYLTHPYLYMNQHQTQQNRGGLTDAYRALGTYRKSFYSLMLRPDAVSITAMGAIYQRLHHRIDWDLAVPKIIRPIELEQNRR